MFLFGVDFVNSAEGWAVGGMNVTVHTTDGGESWESQRSDAPGSLYGVCFIDEDTGWSVGDPGIIMHTNNGGRTWEQQEAIVEDGLSDICYDGKQTLWIVGENGVILKGKLDLPLPKVIQPDEKAYATWGDVRNSALFQNYPNPFNPDTWIPYQLAEDSEAIVTIYNATGHIVKMLDMGHRKAGYHITHWDGKDDSGQPLTSGIYFCILKTDDGFSDTRKMVLLQ